MSPISGDDRPKSHGVLGQQAGRLAQEPELETPKGGFCERGKLAKEGGSFVWLQMGGTLTLLKHFEG
jgi:hypothetical protein